MNRGVIHIVLVVLALVALVYGIYLGVGSSHGYAQGTYYLVMALAFGGATRLL